MINKLQVRGFHFDIKQGREARDNGKILTAGVETNYRCNLNCAYCAWDSSPHREKYIDIKYMRKFIDDVQKKGAKSVTIIGGGEPTLYYEFKQLVQYIREKDMTPILITNGIEMDRSLAEFLYKNDCSIFLKTDSLKPEIQNYLVGTSGAFERINKSLNILMELGFNTVDDENNTRLAISTVVTKHNIGEVPELWRFAKKNNIFPNLEILNTNDGRAKNNSEDLNPSKNDLDNMFKIINDIDKDEFNIAMNHDIDSICCRHIYSVYLNVDGYIQPCSAMRIKEHNIKEKSLDEILESDFYSNLRNSENCPLNSDSRAVYNSQGQ